MSTTRRHPRSLVEAFPSEYAWRGVVEHHKRPLLERVWDAIFTVLAASACGIGIFLYLSR